MCSHDEINNNLSIRQAHNVKEDILRHNFEAWRRYDFQEYTHDNYGVVHEEDAQIITEMARFYSKGQRYQNALELGAGTNLYPIIGLSPYVDRLTIMDIAPAGIAYLERNMRELDANWEQFIDKFRLISNEDFADILRKIQATTIFEINSISAITGSFDLISTHCCIAESATDEKDFIQLSTNLISHLRNGKDFVATFAAESNQTVHYGNELFYVVKVTESLLVETFSPLLDNFVLQHFVSPNDKFRSDYNGLFFVTGTAKAM